MDVAVFLVNAIEANETEQGLRFLRDNAKGDVVRVAFGAFQKQLCGGLVQGPVKERREQSVLPAGLSSRSGWEHLQAPAGGDK